MASESGKSGGFPVDPLHQFQIHPIVPIHIGGYDFSFTNAALWMVISVGLVSAFTIFSMRGRAMVPGRWQSSVEIFYEFIANMVRDNAGHDARRFFPLVFTLFMFIFFANMIGLFPYAFTVTSHIIVTFALAGSIFLLVTITGFVLHGPKFLGLFVPHGVPAVLLPLVVGIEVISYISRPISHSVRLFANMLAGHITLKVFAGFIISFITGLGAIGWIAAILPLLMIVAITALEVLVGALQAYVFAILTCMYLRDALHPGH
ncbi:MAG: F0F1 ATP synthase subunit A [Parvibaculaceae bacterium]|nr:F0F1 ATP synthase subunit A [Parvibaculaceae bacterium]